MESILFWDNLDTYSTDTLSIGLGNISRKNPPTTNGGVNLTRKHLTALSKETDDSSTTRTCS
jgi:hypothetical protein